MITAYIRFGDLACWLALGPLRQLQRDTGVAIEFLPLLNAMGDISSSNVRPGEDDPLAAYKARRKQARRKAAAREQARQCEMLGLKPAQGQRRINPLALSLGLVWANSLADEQAIWRYVETAFAVTFREIADVESLGGVEMLLEASGISVDRFTEAFMAQAGTLQDDQENWLGKGILSSPAFEVDDEIYLGREHLPLIRWILGGRSGSPPV